MFRAACLVSGTLIAMTGTAQASPASAPAPVPGYEWKRLDYNYFKTLPKEEQSRLKIYRDYEQREPCQNYRDLPVDLVFHDCKLFHRVALPPPPPEPAPAPPPPPAPKIMSSYEIFFPLDSDALDLQANAMVDKAAADIAQYKPTSVIVAGYTDTSGSETHNQTLSEKRAMAVSAALTRRGVANTIVNQEAHGQEDLKVPTANNVREPQNRRTVIHFMR